MTEPSDRDRESYSREEYETLLLLERLESLREQMEELGVRDLAELDARIAAIHRQLASTNG